MAGVSIGTGRRTEVKDVSSFLRREWAWVLLAPLVGLLGTALHEGMHAAAVLLASGDITLFDLVPREGAAGLRLGLTQYSNVSPEAEPWVIAAPYFAANVHALGASRLIPLLPPSRVGKVLFFTSVLTPLIDVSMLFAGLGLRSAQADLSRLSVQWPFVVIGGPIFIGLAVRSRSAFRSQWASPVTLTSAQYFALLTALLALPWLRFLSGLTR